MFFFFGGGEGGGGERGKPEFQEKNLSEQGREPPKTNSTHICRHVRESNPGHFGGRRALTKTAPFQKSCKTVVMSSYVWPFSSTDDSLCLNEVLHCITGDLHVTSLCWDLDIRDWL